LPRDAARRFGGAAVGRDDQDAAPGCTQTTVNGARLRQRKLIALPEAWSITVKARPEPRGLPIIPSPRVSSRA
jgi:hypothetical protein